MYVVLIGLCIIVFSSILPKKSSSGNEASGSGMVREMEETMEGFLAEIEEDNKKLIDTIAHMKQEHSQSVQKLTNRMEVMETQMQEERQDFRRLLLERAEKQERPGAPAPVVSTEPPSSVAAELQPPLAVAEAAPVTIRSRYEDLFQMYDEGKSVEYIARKKGLNKGEVSLIIQLALQEERKGVEK